MYNPLLSLSNCMRKINQMWLLAMLLANSILSYAQKQSNQTSDSEPFKWVYQHLDSTDTRSLRTGYFLNKGFLFAEQLEQQRQIRPSDPESNVVFSSPDHFQSYHMGVVGSTVGRPVLPNEEEVTKVIASYDNQDNTVPVGILQAEGEWMKDYEVEESIEAKKKGRLTNKAYEKIGIYSASVLKEKVYSGKVTFVAPAALYYIGDRQIRDVYIDVADGQGFREIKSGSSFTVDYSNAGEKGIAVKFRTHQGEVLSYSVLDVVTLELEKPDKIFNLTPTNGRALSGGEAQVFMGCDGVFDRPVIIVEGIDQLNINRIADTRRDYSQNNGVTNVDEAFRASGRDVVYLNFADGGADIRTNAVVLERLINEVIRERVGTQRIVIIGESMGGIVARYCLTDMERRGVTHQVSHYISFDSPHLGANVPVGFQNLLIDFSEIGIRKAFNIAQSRVDQELKKLNSPASRQLILRFKGPGPHPDFTTLQNQLTSLGFPRQNGIRNVAIVNGNSNGGRQPPANNFNPGNQTFEFAGTLYGVVTARVRSWTNQINGSNKVSSIVIFTTAVPTTIRERSHTFNAFNYDIVAGGLENDKGLGSYNKWWFNLLNPIEWFGRTFDNFGRGQFSFIPLFSGVAYNGPRTNQNDIQRSVANMRANSWIPFNAVYAGTANTEHIVPFLVRPQWIDLFRVEFNLPFVTGCQVAAGTAAPPTGVSFSSEAELCPLSANLKVAYADVPAISSLYTYRWTVTGAGYSDSRSGESFSFGRIPPPGIYTITLTKGYSNGGGIRSYSRTVKVLLKNDSKCSGGDDGPPGGDPPGGGKPPERSQDIAKKQLLNDVDSVFVSNTKVWPNPANDKLHIVYQVEQAGAISITLTSAINAQQQEVILNTSHRLTGNYEEEYYTDHLANGLYIVTLRTDRTLIQEKVFIQN